MIIKKIEIEKFGKIKNYSMEFEAGLNAISESNEFGKTSIINAIKYSLFAFENKKKSEKYAYLPLDDEKITVKMRCDELDSIFRINQISEASVSTFLVGRTFDGRKYNSILYLLSDNEDDEAKDLNLAKNSIGELGDLIELDEKLKFLTSIKLNKEIVLKKIGDKFLTFSDNSALFFLDSNSIEEHRVFMENSDKNSIDFFKSINYKGRDFDELSKELDERCNILYTGRSNSSSKYAKNQNEIELINQTIRQLDDDERDRRECRSECVNLRDKIEKLEEKIIVLNDQSKELKSKSDILIKNKENLQKLEQEKFDDEIYMICKDLIKNESRLVLLNCKQIFQNVLETKGLMEKAKDLEEELETYEIDDRFDVDLGLAKKQLNFYQDSIAQLNLEKIMKEPIAPSFYSLLILGILFIFGYSYLDVGNDYLYILLSSFVLIYGSFMLRRYKKYLVNRKKRESIIAEARGEKTDEIKKIALANDSIMNLEPISNEYDKIIRKIIQNAEKYRELNIEIEENLQMQSSFFASNPSLIYINDLNFDRICDLAQRYLDHSDKVIFTIKNKNETIEEIIEIIQKSQKCIGVLKGKISSDELNLEDLNFEMEDDFSFSRLKEYSDNLNLKSNKVFDLLDKFRIESEEYKKNLASNEQKLLSEAPITYKKYSSLDKEDLEQTKDKLENENKKYRDLYTVYKVQKDILDRAKKLINLRLKPSYIKNADYYLSRIAKDRTIRIEFSEDSKIIFMDINTEMQINFNMLSSGTKAQVVFCLKLAYLNEKDPDYNLPLIVDDVFLAYDNERRKTALELLEEIAEKRQVIYFNAN